MRKFFASYVPKIELLNKILTEIEGKINYKAKKLDAIAQKKLLDKDDEIYDYEIEIEIAIYSYEHTDDPCVFWIETCKNISSGDKTGWYINDGQNHNVTSCCWKNKELHKQKHCWILHKLYDDFNISWKSILNITAIDYDIRIDYQYTQKIEPLLDIIDR